MARVELTRKKDGIIIHTERGTTYQCGFYIYTDVEWIDLENWDTQELSRFFHSNPKCKLIKSWERKVYDRDPYGRKVFFGVVVKREIWDLSGLMAEYGATPKHIKMDDPPFSLREFMDNM